MLAYPPNIPFTVAGMFWKRTKGLVVKDVSCCVCAEMKQKIKYDSKQVDTGQITNIRRQQL